MTNVDKEVRLAFQRLNHIFMFLSVLLTAVVGTKWLSFFDIVSYADIFDRADREMYAHKSTVKGELEQYMAALENRVTSK